jgi:hypothetical protein
MKYPATLIIIALVCSTAAAGPEQVTCDSPCDCHDAHGEGRWSVKTDPSLPPTDASAIQAVTPSEMFGRPGPDAALTMQSERTGIENKWFALTGRIVELKVEEDGDLHIALHDVTGDKPGVVVCEVPAQPQWCEIRTTVFSWTPTRFPFHTGTAKKLTFGQSPRSAFHPPAQRNAFRRRGTHLQSRLFALRNQWLRPSPSSNRLC